MNESGQTEPQGILGIIIFGINGGKSSLDWPSLLALWHYRFFARSKVWDFEQRRLKDYKGSGNDKCQTPGRALFASSRILPLAEKRAFYCGNNDDLLRARNSIELMNMKFCKKNWDFSSDKR